MTYTAQGESPVANIARGEAECYICHKTLTKSCILSYKQSGSASSVLLYFILKDVLTEDIPLNLMNKQICFLDKNVLVEPQFYN